MKLETKPVIFRFSSWRDNQLFSIWCSILFIYLLFYGIRLLPLFHIAFHIHILWEQLDFSPQLRWSPQRAISSGKKEGRIPPEGGDECLMSSTQSRATAREPRACSLGALFTISVLYSRHKATNHSGEWLMGARSQSLFNTFNMAASSSPTSQTLNTATPEDQGAPRTATAHNCCVCHDVRCKMSEKCGIFLVQIWKFFCTAFFFFFFTFRILHLRLIKSIGSVESLGSV